MKRPSKLVRVPFGLIGNQAAQRRRLKLSPPKYAAWLGVDLNVYRRAMNNEPVLAKNARILLKAAILAAAEATVN